MPLTQSGWLASTQESVCISIKTTLLSQHGHPSVSASILLHDDCVGKYVGLAMPEFGVIIRFRHGAVGTFDASKFWHCAVRCPPQLGASVVLSLYFSGKQEEGFAREQLKEQGKKRSRSE